MIVLTKSEEKEAMPFLKEAAQQARRALCLRGRCGAVIVANKALISAGYNAPPNDEITARKCTEEYTHSEKPKSDRTCCIHAEWRAIMRALAYRPKLLKNATLYFCRVNSEGKPLRSGKPYCTVCSRLALDSGIGTFVLWREEGVCVFDTKEYNEQSYAFHRTPIA